MTGAAIITSDQAADHLLAAGMLRRLAAEGVAVPYPEDAAEVMHLCGYHASAGLAEAAAELARRSHGRDPRRTTGGPMTAWPLFDDDRKDPDMEPIAPPTVPAIDSGAWQLPKRGRCTVPADGVAVAVFRNNRDGDPVIAVKVGADVAVVLGWSAGDRFAVLVSGDPPRTILIRRHPAGYKLVKRPGGGHLQIQFTAPKRRPPSGAPDDAGDIVALKPTPTTPTTWTVHGDILAADIPTE